METQEDAPVPLLQVIQTIQRIVSLLTQHSLVIRFGALRPSKQHDGHFLETDRYDPTTEHPWKLQGPMVLGLMDAALLQQYPEPCHRLVTRCVAYDRAPLRSFAPILLSMPALKITNAHVTDNGPCCTCFGEAFKGPKRKKQSSLECFLTRWPKSFEECKADLQCPGLHQLRDRSAFRKKERNKERKNE